MCNRWILVRPDSGKDYVARKQCYHHAWSLKVSSTWTAKKLLKADNVLQNSAWFGGGPDLTHSPLILYPWTQPAFRYPLCQNWNIFITLLFTIYYYSVELSTHLTSWTRRYWYLQRWLIFSPFPFWLTVCMIICVLYSFMWVLHSKNNNNTSKQSHSVPHLHIFRLKRRRSVPSYVQPVIQQYESTIVQKELL